MAATLESSSQMKRKEQKQLIPDGNTRKLKKLQSQVSLETLALTCKHLRWTHSDLERALNTPVVV